MTHTKASLLLEELTKTIDLVRQAIDQEDGYSTVGDFKKLVQAKKKLDQAVTVNTYKNIPF